jgi:hypothetical protein
MEDIAAALVHLGSEQWDTLLVNDLDTGHELLRQLTNGSERNLNALLAGEFELNLLPLTTLQKPGQPNVDEDVVGDVTAGRDKTCESLGAGRRQLRVGGAIPLSLQGDKLPIPSGKDVSAPGEANLERLVTLGAALLFPGEDKTRHGQASCLTQRRGFLLFLAEEFTYL